MQAKQNQGLTHCFPGGQMFSHFQASRAPAVTPNVPLPSFFPPAFISQHNAIIWYRIPLAPVGLSCPDVSPPNPRAPQPGGCGGRVRSRGGRDAVSAAEALLCYQHCCVISTAVPTGSKQSLTRAAVKNVNSIPAKTSTGSKPCLQTHALVQ